MAPKRKSPQVDAATAKAGRLPGVPNYLAQENLAISLAALEASEMRQTQPEIDLSATTDAKYGAQLTTVVIPTYGWPEKAGTKAQPNYTPEKSIKVRSSGLFSRWTATIKPYCINEIQTIYTEYQVSGGGKEPVKPSTT